MSHGKLIAALAIAFVIALLAKSGLYTVSETQQAVITQFGEVKREVKDAGLHVKTPFLEQVNYYEKRLIEWDGKPEQVPTMDKRYIWVDTFARWRISDPLLFRQSVTHEELAQGRLDDIINGTVRNQISNHLLIDAVRSSNREMQMIVGLEGERAAEITQVQIGRDKITEKILAEAAPSAQKFGIELVDIRIKRINYVEQVQQSVYERMIVERQRIAAKYRSEGEGQMMEIEGRKEKEEKQIISEAYKQAEEIRGKADAEAIKIYAQAYSNDPEFYSFIETLKSYEANLGKGSVVILSSDSDYLKYLDSWGQVKEGN
jgi:membrane protease subunit HflC